MLFTATTVLVTMQNTLNRIFEVKASETEGLGIWEMVCDRLISFTLLVTISFILLVSLVVDALITAFGKVAEVDWRIGDLRDGLRFYSFGFGCHHRADCDDFQISAGRQAEMERYLVRCPPDSGVVRSGQVPDRDSSSGTVRLPIFTKPPAASWC